MGILRSVGGWGEVDLDQRAITTEDDIVDLSELDRSEEQRKQSAPATQNGPRDPDPPGEARTPATDHPHTGPGEGPSPADVPGQDGGEGFDHWVADRTPARGGAVASSVSRMPPSARDARRPATGEGTSRTGSGAAEAPCDDATVPAVTSRRRRLRGGGWRSEPFGWPARLAAVVGVLALIAVGAVIAINAAATGTPRAQPRVATSNAAALAAGRGDRVGAAFGAAIAAVDSELRALARTVPPARGTSHTHHKARRHHPSHKAGTSHHRQAATVSERSTATAQTSPPPQTYNSTPAPVTSSSTSQATASSHTQTTKSQPAFGQNGTLGPGRGAPNTQ
jgi:hypothetical protein